ncbi:DNA-directed RNA polymerase III subunit RPC6 [Grifola frondosa]|uniref:DNA-directed RNA polymerase III subunit RPC6 n=1 Tax=Grifola frondosa TaxID=5627 RepID=A0A1C7LPZ0_GRIFR|nr:DNA-directed RNA polymerase III subunit RPC6 [Grifola frondosa]
MKSIGIWTKHLKAKTELHQTVIDRCLKSLTQKQLIKAVKSVKYPTRKIYMLFHLDPSVEMTGGPWYTIMNSTPNSSSYYAAPVFALSRIGALQNKRRPKIILRIHSRSTPSQRRLPTHRQQILTFLSKSRITETELNVDHVEMLLNVLVLDGEIEKVPAFGAAMWESNAGDAQPASESEEERITKKRKARIAKTSRESVNAASVAKNLTPTRIPIRMSSPRRD